jgi:hypothetical protein
MPHSKPLGIEDESAFSFVKEILKGDSTYAINFDRLQKHPQRGYIIFEFLLCEETQMVNPLTSHPNRYWNKNARKFISLFRVAQDLKATLYLVNYAKGGTKHQNSVKVLKVIEINEGTGITKEESREFTRDQFSHWFRKLNDECG